jgi:short-subunit dehydrogenase
MQKPLIKNNFDPFKVLAETDSNVPKIYSQVNNAGMGQSKPFLEVTEDELDDIYAVNVKPIVNVSQGRV